LVAAYGTMPIAGRSLLRCLAWISTQALRDRRARQAPHQPGGIAFYVDAATFILSRLHDLAAPAARGSHGDRPRDDAIDFGQAFHELKEGWSFIFIIPSSER
jgi:hypothetical protein